MSSNQNNHLPKLNELKSKLVTIENENRENKRLLSVTAVDNVSLRDAISQNEKKIRQLQDENQETSAKLADQTDLCQQLRESEQSLQRRNEDLEQDIRRIRSRLSDLYDENGDLHNLNRELIDERTALELELDQCASHKSTLELTIEEKDSLIKKNNVLYAKLEGENQSNQNKIQTVEADNRRLRDLVSEKDIHIRQVEGKTKETKAELANQNQLCQKLRESEKSLQRENDQIRSQLADLDNDKRSLQKLNQIVICKRKAVEAELTRCEAHKSTLELTIAEKESLIKNKDALCAKLEGENKSKESQIQTVEADNRQLRDLVSEKDIHIRQVEGKTKETNAELANQSQLCQKLRESEKSLQRENDQIRSQLADLDNDKRSLQKLNQIVICKHKAVEAELKRCEAHKSTLELTIAEKESLVKTKDVLYAKLESENKSKESQIQTVEADNRRLRDLVSEKDIHIRQVEEKTKETKAELANQNQLCQKLRKSEKSLQRENDQIRSQLADLDNDKSSLQKFNQILICKHKAVEKELKRCENQKTSLEVSIMKKESLINNKHALYQNLKEENRNHQHKIEAMKVDNLRLGDLVSQKETDIRKLQEKMDKTSAEIANTNDVCQQLRDLKKSLQQRNDDLDKENEKIRKRLSDVEVERNNLRERIKALTSDLLKLQSELEKSKADKAIVQSEEIRKRLQKLIVETDKIKSAVIRTLKNPERAAKKSELKKIESEYNQNVEHLRKYNLTTTDENFNSAVNKYRNVYKENDSKMKIFMKKLYHIEVFCKNFSESLETNAVEADKDMLQSLDENLKELEELKRIPFIDDFQQENWLYKDILKLNFDTKINLDKLSRDLGSNNDCHNCEVIIYDLREKVGDHEDIRNVKNFLAELGLKGCADVQIRRVRRSRGNPRDGPVIVKFPNEGAANYILSRQNKLKEIGMSHVKITRYNRAFD